MDGYPWRRLSPRMLLVHPFKEIGRFLPALVAAAIFGSSTGDPWWFVVIVTVAFLIVGALRWWTTRYRFTADRVELQHGLFTKQLLTTPIDRVRSVDVTASPLHRVLALAKVRIGTGAGESDLVLDGLTGAQAANLRAELLHRDPQLRAGGGAQEDLEQPLGERVLLTWNPTWVRFAPFNPSNMVIVLVLAGFVFRIANDLHLNPSSNPEIHDAIDWLRGLVLPLAVLLATVAVLALAAVLAMAGYLLAFYGFRLTADEVGHTWHVTRGLLTTRSTSLDTRRIRGVTINQPVPLRWVGGARLSAITTGLHSRHEERRSRDEADLLSPPAPLPVVAALASDVVATAVLTHPVKAHGPVATRRRFTRALWPTLVVVAGLVIAATIGPLPHWVAYAAPILLPAAALLAWDRARRLGHAIAGDYLLSRTGGLGGAMHVVRTDGTVAVVMRRSYFQRRQGVASVELATAAGAQGYTVLDVPLAQATSLAATLMASERRTI
ncbi:PH domain-containing protein [Branchiibius cervicis]|uniref:PH domain-containing protein n=1 Tax=Branchiibius cervicis TaxID=908252 RepID=A0ABW2AVG3_9MICO